MAGKRLARNKGRSILYKWDGKFACRGHCCEQRGGGADSKAYLYKTGDGKDERKTVFDENCRSLYMRGLKNLTAGDTISWQLRGITPNTSPFGYGQYHTAGCYLLHQTILLLTLLIRKTQRSKLLLKKLSGSDKTVEKITHMSTTLKMLAVGFYPV